VKTIVATWDRFWFTPIPTHPYALLRVLYGLLGILELLGLSDLGTFWAIDGMVPDGDGGLGLKALIAANDWSGIAAPALYCAMLVAFAAMTLGYQTEIAITASLFLSVYQSAWNPLPLSGAHAAVVGVLFCLIWADCSSVWSLDALIAGRRAKASPSAITYPIAPLRLIQFQIALVYLSAGLWKLNNPLWRDGSALHYVLNNNVFRRLPMTFTPAWEILLTIGTYATLFWEIGFAFAVLFKPTRRFALISGIAVHLGMMAGLEVGLFPFVMVSGYVAFLDPHRIAELPLRVKRVRFLGPLRKKSQDALQANVTDGGDAVP